MPKFRQVPTFWHFEKPKSLERLKRRSSLRENEALESGADCCLLTCYEPPLGLPGAPQMRYALGHVVDPYRERAWLI